MVSPAVSRNVVDKIQAAIEPDVKKLFDELGEPEVFDYKAEIAERRKQPEQDDFLSTLLKHKDQVAKALETPDTFSNAFSEINRWSTKSKMGFARYAPEDMELLGEKITKGQIVGSQYPVLQPAP